MNQGERNKGRVVISISTPVVVLGILIALWATNNLDNIIASARAPGLTHACIAANSLGAVARCAAYKLENASSPATDTSNSVTTDAAVQTTTRRPPISRQTRHPPPPIKRAQRPARADAIAP